MRLACSQSESQTEPWPLPRDPPWPAMPAARRRRHRRAADPRRASATAGARQASRRTVAAAGRALSRGHAAETSSPIVAARSQARPPSTRLPSRQDTGRPEGGTAGQGGIASRPGRHQPGSPAGIVGRTRARAARAGWAEGALGGPGWHSRSGPKLAAGHGPPGRAPALRTACCPVAARRKSGSRRRAWTGPRRAPPSRARGGRGRGPAAYWKRGPGLDSIRRRGIRSPET